MVTVPANYQKALFFKLEGNIPDRFYEVLLLYCKKRFNQGHQRSFAANNKTCQQDSFFSESNFDGWYFSMLPMA